MELKAIGPVSSAKVMALFYAAIGLVAGVVVACITLVGAALGTGGEHANPLLGSMFGVAAIVLFPVLYGVLGALGGLILSGL